MRALVVGVVVERALQQPLVALVVGRLHVHDARRAQRYARARFGVVGIFADGDEALELALPVVVVADGAERVLNRQRRGKLPGGAHQERGGALAIADVEQRVADHRRQPLAPALVGLVREIDLGEADVLVDAAELAAHHAAAIDGLLGVGIEIDGPAVELHRAQALGHQHLAGDAELEEPERLFGSGRQRLADALQLLYQRPTVATIAQPTPHFRPEFQALDYITGPPSAGLLEGQKTMHPGPAAGVLRSRGSRRGGLMQISRRSVVHGRGRFVGGRFVMPAGRTSALELRSPADPEDLLGIFPLSDEDAEDAVAAATAAAPRWAARTVDERAVRSWLRCRRRWPRARRS